MALTFHQHHATESLHVLFSFSFVSEESLPLSQISFDMLQQAELFVWSFLSFPPGLGSQLMHARVPASDSYHRLASQPSQATMHPSCRLACQPTNVEGCADVVVCASHIMTGGRTDDDIQMRTRPLNRRGVEWSHHGCREKYWSKVVHGASSMAANVLENRVWFLGIFMWLNRWRQTAAVETPSNFVTQLQNRQKIWEKILLPWDFHHSDLLWSRIRHTRDGYPSVSTS